MLKQPKHSFDHSLRVAAAVLMAVSMSACASQAASTNTSASAAPAQASHVIAQLQQAKTLDEEGAKDPSISIPREEDYIVQAQKADRAIRELQAGYSLSDREIADALDVPPRHVTSEQRAELIKQLKDAVTLDEQREQGAVAFGERLFDGAADAPAKFGYQEALAQKQIERLQSGQHVEWEQVKQALYVPPNPL